MLVGRWTSKQAMTIQDETCTDEEMGRAVGALGKGPGPNKRKSRARRNSPVCVCGGGRGVIVVEKTLKLG